MSTKSTNASQYNPQFADATNVLGEVHSLSPFLSPIAKQAICKALVALLTATTCLAFNLFEIFFSNKLTTGP